MRLSLAIILGVCAAGLLLLSACSSPPEDQVNDAGGLAYEDARNAEDATDAPKLVVTDTSTDDLAADVEQGVDLAPDLAPDLATDAMPDSFDDLPVCGVTLLEAFTLDRIEPPAADSDQYVVPPESSLATFEQSIRAATAGDFETARDTAADVDYVLCRGTGEYDGSVLYEPAARGSGHAVLALRVRDESVASLMLQAPHIIHDTNTLPQSVAVFEATKARALLVSGTHRCASSEAGCSGSSTVCNRADGGYAESDMAHSVRSFFQAAHVAVSESYSQHVVISLHGMSRAGASISDGTSGAVAVTSPVAQVVSALIDQGAENVTACNEGTLAPVEQHLCGTTNTQGRHLNGSPDVCESSAPDSSGRFVHLEQERSLRDDPTRVAAALAGVFAP